MQEAKEITNYQWGESTIYHVKDMIVDYVKDELGFKYCLVFSTDHKFIREIKTLKEFIEFKKTWK